MLLLSADKPYDLRGSFRLSFMNNVIPGTFDWDVSEEAMSEMLSKHIPAFNSGSVHVRRYEAQNGFAWFVQYRALKSSCRSTQNGATMAV